MFIGLVIVKELYMKGERLEHRRDQVKGHYMQDPYHDVHNDPYYQKKKLEEGTHCRTCDVEYRKGVFHWANSTSAATESTFNCPACRRAQDGVVGGCISIKGSYVALHREEIEHLIRNVETLEKQEHPMQRIMAFTSFDDGFEVTTTYEHIARRIGEALYGAHKGDLEFTYGDQEKFIRVMWSRDA